MPGAVPIPSRLWVQVKLKPVRGRCPGPGVPRAAMPRPSCLQVFLQALEARLVRRLARRELAGRFAGAWQSPGLPPCRKPSRSTLNSQRIVSGAVGGWGAVIRSHPFDNMLPPPTRGHAGVYTWRLPSLSPAQVPTHLGFWMGMEQIGVNEAIKIAQRRFQLCIGRTGVVPTAPAKDAGQGPEQQAPGRHALGMCRSTCFARAPRSDDAPNDGHMPPAIESAIICNLLTIGCLCQVGRALGAGPSTRMAVPWGPSCVPPPSAQCWARQDNPLPPTQTPQTTRLGQACTSTAPLTQASRALFQGAGNKQMP